MKHYYFYTHHHSKINRLTSKEIYEPPHDKTNKMTVRLAKTQISLGIRPIWSESSQCAQWVAKDPSFLHADSEDSGQTGRMPRLIWVIAWRTATLLVLSWGGSYLLWLCPLQIYDDRISYGTFCGINEAHTIISTSNVLNVHFVTDGGVKVKGFTALYSAIGNF